MCAFATYANHFIKLNFKIIPPGNSNKEQWTDSILNARYWFMENMILYDILVEFNL